MDNESSVGDMVWTLGYCTQAWFLRGKSLGQLEDMLGFTKGRLDNGATILFLQRLPGPEDFQLAGYTYFSDGTQGGHKLKLEERGPYRMESLLKSEHGWSDSDIRRQKEGMLRTKIVIRGYERLAKLCPVTAHTEGEQYPPGMVCFKLRYSRLRPKSLPARNGEATIYEYVTARIAIPAPCAVAESGACTTPPPQVPW